MSEYEDFARSLQQSYQSNGFALIRELLPRDVVTRLRIEMGELFDHQPRYDGDIYDHPSLGDIRIDVFNRYPAVWQALFESQMVAVLQILLGEDFVLLPESAMHRRGYGSWHKDTDSQQKAGHRFHWEPDCEIVQIAWYFQANTHEYGGGVEVIPGSHRVDLRWYEDSQKGYRVPSAAGDLVIFNTRLDHKACWPTQPVPRAQDKYGVFFMASRNNGHAKSYLDFIRERPGYLFMKGFKFPGEVQRLAQAMGFKLLV
ncbi:phytanoyl-CoA dioxygenase family protein [Pseudomonas oryzihabitans]|uniref:phytanoyl-CoA dioxygenase family protein n=1 Tax=Pseudomonas oryzihabitans TaxID=47885 RepID=UPI0005A7FC5D|nr:phytanoyl-CoA dioxygenase family protein [Pseudomonas oryzihabitans]NMZ44361.1 phytanoyl-CoA dioxygenase family protein [Pseudomonas oryzihabitans]